MRALLVTALVVAGCGSAPPAAEHARATRTVPCATGATDSVGEDPTFACIATGVWMFTALAPADFMYPRYPANGLVLEAGDHAILVDTGWSDGHALAIVEWSAVPITAAMVTHSHQDRTGGVRLLVARGIPVFGTATTIALATEHGDAAPDHELVEGALPELRWYFPGPAHSPDNIVVWLEASRTLFGGCMIKELAAESLGNVADADTMGWLSAIDGVVDLFGEPTLVVPGHGAPGDASLLSHTLVLLGPNE